MNTCRKCSKEFEPSKGFINYCSFLCRQGRIWTDVEKQKKSEACKKSEKVKDAYKKREVWVNYSCEKCNDKFTSKTIRSNRHIHCEKCTRKVVRFKNGESILDYSLRTVAKIIKKANIPCQNCEYSKASRDIHHIIPRKEGGSNENNNLVVLCPNCHREAHEGYIERDFLKTKSIDKTFCNYKDFYHKI